MIWRLINVNKKQMHVFQCHCCHCRLSRHFQRLITDTNKSMMMMMNSHTFFTHLSLHQNQGHGRSGRNRGPRIKTQKRKHSIFSLYAETIQSLLIHSKLLLLFSSKYILIMLLNTNKNEFLFQNKIVHN